MFWKKGEKINFSLSFSPTPSLSPSIPLSLVVTQPLAPSIALFLSHTLSLSVCEAKRVLSLPHTLTLALPLSISIFFSLCV